MIVEKKMLVYCVLFAKCLLNIIILSNFWIIFWLIFSLLYDFNYFLNPIELLTCFKFIYNALAFDR